MLQPESDALFTDVYVAPTLLYIQNLVRKAFGAHDPYHGLGHALDVERNAYQLCGEPDVHLSNAERFLIRAAALLHDIGYAAYEPSWSLDRREHVQFGLDLIMSQGRNAPLFQEYPAWIAYIIYIVALHNASLYDQPSAAQNGFAVPVDLSGYSYYLESLNDSLTVDQQLRLRRMIGVLGEADALTGTGTAGAKRIFNEALDRGLPPFAPGDPLASWAWETSAAGNVRLAARRLQREAISASGRRSARQHAAAAETFLMEMCQKDGVACTAPEALPDADDRRVRLLANDELFITRVQTFAALETCLRRVTLVGDEHIQPYRTATIVPRRMRLDALAPAAYYGLESQLEAHHRLYASLATRYALSLFELTGILDYSIGTVEARITPPLVETYHDGETHVSLILDGLHRALLARQLGLESLWVIEIRDVPAYLPPLPLPLGWDEVSLHETVSSSSAKRAFRYPTYEQFPDVSAFSHESITRENFLYFFYRDLSPLDADG